MVKEISQNNQQLDNDLQLDSAAITGELEGRDIIQPPQSIAQKTGKWGKIRDIFSRQYTSLYIDDAGIKLMVVRGKRVTKWVEQPLEPGLVIDGVIIDTALMAEKVKSLLQEHRIRANKIITGFNGLHCLSRVITLPVLNRNLLSEAIRHEAERELPVPLENLYLAWQIISTSRTEIKVFLIAYTRSIVDSMVQTLRKAGVKLYLMDLAPLAITRVMNRMTAAVVDIRSSGMDIVVMVEGVPELIRSLPLPQGKSWQEKQPIIKDELDRTLKFWATGKPENLAREDLPVFASGMLLDTPEIYQSLSEQLGYNFLPPFLPLSYPDQLIANRYTVNIGLILKKLSPGKNAEIPLINVNALPEIYRPRHIAIGRILAVTGAVAAAGLIFCMLMLVRQMNTGIEASRADLKASSQTLVQRQAQQKSLNESISINEKKAAEATQNYETINGAKTSLEAQQKIVNGDLDLSTGAMASSITLTGIKHTGAVMTVTGTAPGEVPVLNYARYLGDSGRYSEIVISSMDQKDDQSMAFTLNIKMKD